MPTAAATAWAVAALSPVSIHTCSPSALSWATASADSALIGSATTSRPAAWPSTAANIGVCPAAAGDAGVGEQGGVADQDPAAVDGGVDAAAGDRGELLQRRQDEPAVSGCGDD